MTKHEFLQVIPELDSDSKEKGLEIKCIIDKKLNEKKTSLKKLEQKQKKQPSNF